MDLSRQEYPALLASLQPTQAATVLADRVRIINKVNADIADWLQERRRIEEAYAQGLRKLSHRPQLDNAASLGIFQIPWQRIVNSVETVATSHETFAQKIDEDVERSLREFGTKNKELASMPGVQNDLTNLAKNLDTAQKKVDKAKDKGPKGADRLASAVTAAQEVRQQWESRAPFVFEQLQAADETRLNHLRDILTQLETHESDQIERCRQAAESCLNVLLNVETADEIKTFAARVNGGRPVAPLRQQTSPTPQPPLPPLPPPPRIQDDAASQRSQSSGRVRVPPPVPEPRHGSALGGLRRLGTVMNRRKSVVIPSGGPSSEKKYRSPFSFKRGNSGEQIPEDPHLERPGTAVTSLESYGETRIPSESYERGGHDRMTSSPVPQSTSHAVNGHASQESPAMAAPAGTSSSEPRVDSEGFSQRPQIIDEITQAQREASGQEEPGLNLTIRDQPIPEDESQAKQALDDMANQLRLQAQHSGLRRNAGTIRGRRDVRNTVFIPTIAAQGNTVPGLTMAQDNSEPASPLSPARHATSPSTATDDHTLSDTTSIRSSHTLHSISGPVAHPELHEPGLNASVIETVNAWFSEGAVTKSFVVGELALAFNGTPEASAERIRVRLNNFQILEKVAANPHFIREIKDQGQSDDKRGEYDVVVSNLMRPAPSVAFKYQVHINSEDTSAFCPVIFKPAWNLEEFQASVIIFYSLNPSFASSVSRDSITLTNLVLTVNLDTSPQEDREVAHATSAVMYPNSGAVFRRKQSAVIWKIPEFEVNSGSDGKLLVRFSTSNSWPQKGKVEAKFEVRTADSGSRLEISAVSRPGEAVRTGSDPFADEAIGPALWKDIPTTRKLAVGKYVSS
ncbi:Muniscin C-terminal mu homology domain-containing protein [Aspergillus cavernicola]|uniref:Muniscin C-terminal mu homology domain-containing protein n=1 Tax=Aspergillus cavernicola TaxID=176166 RepID=A0ABR4I0K2_9EURO